MNLGCTSMSFLQGQSVVQRICVLKKHLIYRDFQERFENRFPLRASLKGGARTSKKPYVSVICKVFSFFGQCIRAHKKAGCPDLNRDLFRSNRKEVTIFYQCVELHCFASNNLYAAYV